MTLVLRISAHYLRDYASQSIGHVVFVAAAVPAVLRTGNAIIPFAIALFILAVASAAIKACVTPIITYQCPIDTPRVQIYRPAKGWRRWLSFGPKGVDGEKVIVDPVRTFSCASEFHIDALPGSYDAEYVDDLLLGRHCRLSHAHRYD